ncbi:MAG: calcium-binding protein [Dolichospermum sp. UKL201]|nr:MAG: calcium-binding protein [Dolichospermum sp. UKL201]
MVIYGSNGNDALYGGAGNDSLYGGAGNDSLYGGDGNDYLDGGDGNDYLDGGFGFDTINGGTGVDTTSYAFYGGPINANLATGVVSFPGNSTLTDTLISIENLIGTAGNDTIYGSTADNDLRGGAGNDSLYGGDGNDYLDGGFGFDTINGGTGVDTTSYAFYGGPINANLATGVVSFPGNSTLTDTLISIENLIGTAGNDTIYGSTADNDLRGGAGNDLLTGGIGKDTLTGGLGADRFDYRNLADSVFNTFTFDVITDFNATAGNDLFVVSTARSVFSNAGNVAALDATSIAAILTNTTFTANSAAQFSIGSRTFVAINDTTAGFSSTTDAIIEVTGLTGTLGLNNFTTTLA